MSAAVVPAVEAQALHAAAEALRSARARRQPIAPISATFGIAGLDAAYAVAALNTQAGDKGARFQRGLNLRLFFRLVFCAATLRNHIDAEVGNAADQFLRQ